MESMAARSSSTKEVVSVYLSFFYKPIPLGYKHSSSVFSMGFQHEKDGQNTKDESNQKYITIDRFLSFERPLE